MTDLKQNEFYEENGYVCIPNHVTLESIDLLNSSTLDNLPKTINDDTFDESKTGKIKQHTVFKNLMETLKFRG